MALTRGDTLSSTHGPQLTEEALVEQALASENIKKPNKFYFRPSSWSSLLSWSSSLIATPTRGAPTFSVGPTRHGRERVVRCGSGRVGRPRLQSALPAMVAGASSASVAAA